MILLTAFDAFGDWAENPSARVLEKLIDRNVVADGQVVAQVLPTAFGAARTQLLGLLAQADWQACVMLGVAQDREALTPEAFALNVAHARIADNAGAQPRHEVLAADGPAAYASSLPLVAMVAAAQAAGVAAEVSYHAGTYVCNATFYAAMHWCAQVGSDMPCGFLHVPPLEEVALETQVMALEKMLAQVS